MRYSILIPYNGVCYSYRLFCSQYDRIELPGVVIFDISEIHVHRYDLQAFFYDRKVIISNRSYRSKKELHGAIRKLLQEYLNVVVQ